MKINGWLLVLFLGTLAVPVCFGQSPPPNDNFTNHTVLTGTDLTFSGTLAGATLEDSRETTAFNNVIGNPPATQSVWWSWTAPVSTVLTLQILDSSPQSTQVQDRDCFVIYDATNGGATLDDLSLPPLGAVFLDLRLTPQSLSVPVSAGTNYTIQLIGSTSANYTVRLIATNPPVVLQQPRSRTVYSNSTALFYVVSAGVNQPAFTFQWYFNGTNLPGETAPMLALSNIDDSLAGAYTVVVSNSAGDTTSAPAMLSVSQSNVPIFLAVTGTQSGFLSLSLAGESGRSYELQSSTDFVSWPPDLEFEREPLATNSTSVVFVTNSPLNLTVANNSSRKFFRAAPYVLSPAETDECVNHLEQIRIAKMLWQRDYAEIPMGEPLLSDLIPYFPRHVLPFCPLDPDQTFDTSYSIDNLLVEPICHIEPSSHIIEEPR